MNDRAKNNIDLSQDNLRVTIVALLIALNFGILTYFEDDKKFDSITFEAILKVNATVFVKVVLIIFSLYIVTLGLSKTYKKTTNWEIHPFLYDLGLALTALTVFLTSSLSLGIIISPFLNNNTIFIKIYLLTTIIIGGRIVWKMLEQHIKDNQKRVENLIIRLFKIIVDIVYCIICRR